MPLARAAVSRSAALLGGVTLQHVTNEPGGTIGFGLINNYTAQEGGATGRRNPQIH